MHDCIPVMLELKQFISKEVDLISSIAEELAHFGFPTSKEFAMKALETGKLMILLDGLDEVPSQFTNSVMNAIDNLVTRYEDNRFIASCRIAAYRSNFQHDFQVIELADFDDNQIEQFITNWFSSELDKQSQTAEKCWETLNDESNKAAKELAQTPLLLTFLCLVYNRKQSFPPNRSRLFDKALDILLEEWAAEKRLQQEPIFEGLHTDLEKVMLAEFAHHSFQADRLFFDGQQIVKSIQEFLADSVDNPKYLNGREILNAISTQQGILVERAEGIFSFSHLTLQEYLTAKYISEDNRRIEKLVEEHSTDKRWKEVFLLVAGLKDDAVELLKLLEKKTQSLINTDKLHQLLVWANDRADDEALAFDSIGARAFVLANAFAYSNPNAYTNIYAYTNTHAYFNNYALANAYTYAKAKANAKAYAYALENFIYYARWSEGLQIYQDVNFPRLIFKLEKLQQQIPKQSTEEVYRAFGKEIIELWLEAFHLDPQLVDLSQPEIQALDRYFSANLLILECSKASVRLSRKTWSAIHSRIFMPFSS